jgi:hypothetical protein
VSSTVALRPRLRVPLAETAQARERWARRRVALAWGLLVLNVMTFYPRTWSGLPLALPIPSILGKGVTQGALPMALIVALTVNRRRIIRPNVYLCLISLLVLGALLTSLQAENIGTIYRTFRLAGFVATLWLLTPWWGRRDLLLVRCHLTAMAVVLGTVLLGLALSPSDALGQGRLAGDIWPTPPTQVAEFAAVTFGLVVILWLCGRLSGRVTLLTTPIAAVVLLMTHTRTALLAMVVALFIAGLSLVTVRARVRKLFASVAVVASIGALTVSSFATKWLARGEDSQQITDLTGRTSVWTQVVNIPRSKFEDLFGFGLSNKSFNGLPIDSNWLATYYDQGLYGCVICGLALLFLLVQAYFAPRGVQRALALFLVTYCLLASFTETGFSDASTYMLELTLGASMLVPSVTGVASGTPE